MGGERDPGGESPIIPEFFAWLEEDWAHVALILLAVIFLITLALLARR